MKDDKMNLKYLFLTTFLSAALLMAGCGPAVVSGAAYGGYKGATDQRTVGSMMDDSILATKVKTKMISDEFVKARDIDVDVLNQVVFLVGVVESESQKRMAADIARGVEGVRGVENQLVVGRTSIGQDVNDAVLSSKIKAKLIQTKDIRSTNIDVDTNNNIVTLTGIVGSEAERQKALYVVQQVAGNRQIINNLMVK